MQIAFIHPGALGDLVLTLPLMQSLVRRGGRITLFAVGERGRLLAGRSAVAEAFPFEDSALTPWFGPTPPPPGPGPHEGFDRVVCADDDGTLSRNLAALLPAARIDRLAVRPAAIDASGLHASEFLHRQVFGAEAETPAPWIVLTEGDRAAGAALMDAGVGPPGPPCVHGGLKGRSLAGAGREAGRRTLVIHPGSGGRAKCWPIEAFLAVAERLAAGAWRVVFVLGEAEIERFEPADREAAAARFPTLSGLSLVELAGLIGSADAYLGNDSGPTHLAAAIGVATVALFGPTDPAVWGPRGRQVTIVRGDRSAGPAWGIRPAEIADRFGRI